MPALLSAILQCLLCACLAQARIQIRQANLPLPTRTGRLPEFLGPTSWAGAGSASSP